MSFSFGFSVDEEEDVQEQVVQEFVDPLVSMDASNKNYPLEVSLDSILQSLVGQRISFEKINLGNDSVQLYRRELFDIKHQLMLEDDKFSDNKEEFQVLIGDTQEDLKKFVYEGGLKSWECSIDTVNYLSAENKYLADNKTYIELGCGTSLPSLFIFVNCILGATKRNRFILSDFNESVLRLVTVPNLLVNWFMTLSPEERVQNLDMPLEDNEMMITEALVSQFQQLLATQQYEIQLIKGSWCLDFYKLLPTTGDFFIISSETIYQPEILPVISELILRIVVHAQKATALVAAKDIYFGVGGSINSFVEYLGKRQENDLQFNYKMNKLSSNLQRSIVLIESI